MLIQLNQVAQVFQPTLQELQSQMADTPPTAAATSIPTTAMKTTTLQTTTTTILTQIQEVATAKY
jgi:hypothetical protein